MMKFLIIFLFFSISLFSRVKLGIDKISETNFPQLKGKNIAILTNFSGRDSEGKSSISHFVNNPNFKLKKIFVPEHGYYSAVPAGEHIENDKQFGIDIVSLYGKYRRPTKEMLSDVDIVLIDIQDIGVRSYTYISSIYNVLDACAEYNKNIIILDRPNPLGGQIVDGNKVDKGRESFVSMFPISYIHSLTIGEIALLISGEGLLKEGRKPKIEIVKMEGWERWMRWSDTGLMWFPTSPHIPSVESIQGNTITGVIGELGFISIGIGTTLPFQYIGAPNFDFKSFEEKLVKLFPNCEVTESFIDIDGVELIKTKYYPFYGMNSNKYCDGYIIKYSHNNDIKPFSAGMKILCTLRELYPQKFNNFDSNSKSVEMFKKVTGTELIWNFLISKEYSKIFSKIDKERNEFLLVRNKYLIY